MVLQNVNNNNNNDNNNNNNNVNKNTNENRRRRRKRRSSEALIREDLDLVQRLMEEKTSFMSSVEEDEAALATDIMRLVLNDFLVGLFKDKNKRYSLRE